MARACAAVMALFCASLPPASGAAQSDAKTQQSLVAEERRIVFGGRGAELLMPTGDDNLVEVAFEVSWSGPIAAEKSGRSVLARPESIVRDLSLSIMSELVGQRTLSDMLTGDRRALQDDATRKIQATLDGYGALVAIGRVTITRLDPPRAMLDAFRDVQAADQDVERYRHEAERYANRSMTEARRAAAKILKDSETAYAEQILAARLEVERFKALAEGYRKAPDEQSRRLYIEALRRIPE